MELWRHVVSTDDTGKTLRRLISSRLQASRGLIRRLRMENGLLVNNQPAWLSQVLQAGDEVRLVLADPTRTVRPEPIPLNIVHEDSDLLVVDKPPGIVVHPTRGYPSGTLANAIAHHFDEQGTTADIHPVNRLDKNTSGLVAFAKNPYAHEQLSRGLNQRSVERLYTAVVAGVIGETRGAINLPIARVPDHPVKRKVRPDGQAAITHFEVVRRWAQATLLTVWLETGRTHQIRVHLSHLGYPLLGDHLYTSDGEGKIADHLIPIGDQALIGRQALHAGRLRLIHPRNGGQLELTAPLPADMRDLIEALDRG
jgi:23S rRNA pseudouridine1911/1915/1917 synthase